MNSEPIATAWNDSMTPFDWSIFVNDVRTELTIAVTDLSGMNSPIVDETSIRIDLAEVSAADKDPEALAERYVAMLSGSLKRYPAATTEQCQLSEHMADWIVTMRGATPSGRD